MYRLLSRTTSSGFRLHCNQNGTPFLQYLNLKFLSTTKTPLSTADYLVTSLGVSPESALEIGDRIDLKSVSNADSVIALFKNYGFAPTHIAELASKHRKLLSIDPQKTLKPKLDFFVGSGISGDALVHLITNNTKLLNQSLNKRIVPSIDFLKTFFGSTQALISIFALKRGSMVLRYFSDNMPSNFETLRRCGVPDASIVRLIVIGASCLCHDCERFQRNVKEVVEMGFDLESSMFVQALFVISAMSKEKRAAKVGVFRNFGWTEEQIQALFMKCPKVFSLSEERLKKALGVFRNRVQWEAKELSRVYSTLSLSLDKRVLPRLAVLEILILKGLKERTCIYKALMVSEDVFLDKFVMKHGEEVPLILELYRK